MNKITEVLHKHFQIFLKRIKGKNKKFISVLGISLSMISTFDIYKRKQYNEKKSLTTSITNIQKQFINKSRYIYENFLIFRPSHKKYFPSYR